MTKKNSKQTSLQDTSSGSLGLHGAISHTDKNAYKANKDNSGWWLYALILVIIGLVLTFFLASFTP